METTSKRSSRNRLIDGIGLFLIISLSFAVANLWSSNQLLQEQLEAANKGARVLGSETSDTSTTQSGPPSEGVNLVPSLREQDHVEGPRSAPVALIEYSDLECPFCERVHPTLKQLRQEYGDKLSLVFRHYPIDSLHPGASVESEVAECVAQVEGDAAFFKFIDVALSSSFDRLTGVAKVRELGFKSEAIEQCLIAGAAKSRVQQDIDEGGQAKVQGTPAIFIVRGDGQTRYIPGAQSIETFRQAIDALLSK